MELKIPAYMVSHRKVKYPRLEFKTGELVVILPVDRHPGALLEKHERWIERKRRFIGECLRKSGARKMVHRRVDEFRKLVYSVIGEAAEKFSVDVNQVFFRKMKTKWASCSSSGNLTINTLVQYLPNKLLRYVIFHEIAHLIEKRHSERFWKIMAHGFGPCDSLEMDLLVFWFRICKGMPIL